MFGFLIGIASAIGLVAVLRSGRCGKAGGRHGGCHGGCHGGGHGGCHGGGHRHGCEGHHEGRGTRGFLRFLFHRLDTTTGQEKEICRAVDDLIEHARSLKAEGKASREEVARVLRSDGIDENALGAFFSRHDDALREAQKAFATALGRIHAALEPEQRAKLADLIESGPRFGFGGPYRHCA